MRIIAICNILIRTPPQYDVDLRRFDYKDNTGGVLHNQEVFVQDTNLIYRMSCYIHDHPIHNIL